MTDDTANLILEKLRRMETKLDALSDRVEVMEDRLSGIEQHLAVLAQSVANIHALFTRFERRLRKLENA